MAIINKTCLLTLLIPWSLVILVIARVLRMKRKSDSSDSLTSELKPELLKKIIIMHKK